MTNGRRSAGVIGQLLCSYQHFHLFTDKVTWKYLAKEKKKKHGKLGKEEESLESGKMGKLNLINY